MTLSIITVNLNNAAGLQQTINSVLTQSYLKNIEYIIIDGGSTDGSIDIIKTKEAGINEWISERDSGIYNAMNKGLEKAKGNYLMFLNSGDTLYSQDTLARILPGLDGTDIVYGSFIIKYPDGTEYKEVNNRPITLLSFLDRERHLCHQSVIMTAKAIREAGGFDESLKIVSDWKLFAISIFKNNATLKFVDLTLSYFLADGISMNKNSIAQINSEKEKVLKELFPYVYADMKRLESIGCSFSELVNSGYMRKVLKILNKMIRFLRRSS